MASSNPPWRRDSYEMASGKSGAVHTDLGREADPFKLHRARREGAEPISERTKGGPSREKANGAKLGNPTQHPTYGLHWPRDPTAVADAFAAAMLPVLMTIRNAGADTLEAISYALNRREIRSGAGPLITYRSF